MKTCVVVGHGSDIYQSLKPMLEADGWTLYNAEDIHDKRPKWNLLLVPMGRVAPVGYWWESDWQEIKRCLDSNLVIPFTWLKWLWELHAPGAHVCFFAGANPNKPMKGYVPYSVGKMALLKLVEHLDYETPDATFFALAPGYVPTKIHRETLEKGWPNERIARGDSGTPIAKIYDALKWCLAQDKATVGGRNICVSDLPITAPLGEHSLKLRRVG